MKRNIVLVMIIIVLGGLCLVVGCADPSAKATGGKATGGEGGSAAIKGAEVTADVTVGAVATNIFNEASYTFAALLKDILFSTFYQIVGCVVAALLWWDWREGNLHPAKPKHRKGEPAAISEKTPEG